MNEVAEERAGREEKGRRKTRENEDEPTSIALTKASSSLALQGLSTSTWGR